MMTTTATPMAPKIFAFGDPPAPTCGKGIRGMPGIPPVGGAAPGGGAPGAPPPPALT